MSVPIPTVSLDWPDTGGLLRENRSQGRSGQAHLPVADSKEEGADAAVTSAAEITSDAELLRDFIASKPGEATAQMALTRIIERHGSLVYQVALRLVNDTHLADDVFQATFLVLAQSARKIQRTGSLASWLHGTARNIGRRALAQKYSVRSGMEAGVEMVTSVEDDPFHEMMRSHERQLLDEELQQLAEIHRAPLVLFYLEERSQLEISKLLGVSVPAVESRLKRAKQELRSRLVRRGITLSVAIAAVGWGASVATAAPPAALVSSTITLAVTSTAVGTSLAAGGSAAVLLAGKELAAMSAASKVTALIVGAAGTLTVGGAVLFGAMNAGLPGTDGSPRSGELSAVIGADSGWEGTEEQEPVLLTQAEGDDPAEVQEFAETEVGDPPEKAESEPAVEVDEDQSQLLAQFGGGTGPATEEAKAGVASTTPQSRLVASFRQLSAKDRKVYEALEQEITLEFPDNTISEIMEFVGATAGIPVRIDRQAFEEAELDDVRVQFIGTHSLDDALSLLLENVNSTALDYYIERGVLHVTTAEKMQNSEMRLRFYDLLGDSDKPNIENLSHAVCEFAETLNVSGEVEVTSLGDSLAIRTTLAIHKQIEEFVSGALQLAEARRAAGKPLPNVPIRQQILPPGGLGGGAGGGGVSGGGSGFFSVPN